MLYEDCVSDVTRTSLSDSPNLVENMHVARGRQGMKRKKPGRDHEEFEVREYEIEDKL